MKELSEKIIQYYRERGKRAVFQLGEDSKFIIISQAPGKKVHDTGTPWNDMSGRTLRSWLGVTDDQFYNPRLFSIMPVDFCYPGKGPHGDLPPDKSCADTWHPKILAKMKNNPVKILIGKYAIDYYLGTSQKESLANTVRSYKDYLPACFPLIHPSPRNKKWLTDHPWFLNETVPALKQLIASRL
ncbi:MAG: uracil-DNA glycosylase family protein [Chitinophagaceae bacterium]|nr:uracil-DNA glycosylase family protein [Chitinophagaceae bacterium]